MKHLLLGTSALALATAHVATADAAEFEMRGGGHFEAYAAYASSDVNGFSGAEFDGIDAKRDVEIFFKPSITLDNGLKIGADVQLEGSSGSFGDYIDESFVSIKGSFGEILIGSENSAGYKMTYAAPDVTFVNVNSGSVSAWIPFSGNVGNNNGQAGIPAGGLNVGDDYGRRTLGSTFIENEGNNDAERFTYFTPRFAGFQLGVSYARDGNQDSVAQLNLNGSPLSHIVDVGANYVNSFGPVDLAVSGRWGIAQNDTPGAKSPQLWGAGLNLGFDVLGGTLSVGGSFAEQNNAGTEDGTSYDAGLSYETGPWAASFTYVRGENVNDEDLAVNTAAGANDEKLRQMLVGVTYKLAKGVKLMGFGAYIDFDEERGDVGGPNVTIGDDVDGFIVGTGIKLSF